MQIIREEVPAEEVRKSDVRKEYNFPSMASSVSYYHFKHIAALL